MTVDESIAIARARAALPVLDAHDVEERAAVLLEDVELPAVERPVRALALDGAAVRLFVAERLDEGRKSGARWRSGYVRTLDDVGPILFPRAEERSESPGCPPTGGSARSSACGDGGLA